MRLNKIMWVSIILLAILSFGAVSAQDNGDLTTASNNGDVNLQVSYDKTIYVSDTGSDSNSGTQESPFKTINKGISSVNASDNAVIYLKGEFLGENNTNLGITLAHKNYNGSLAIIGEGNGKTVIDGDMESSIFKSISADSIVTLIGITFTNGRTDMGSAIRSSGDLTIDNCIFENNYATNLAAIYQDAANNLTIKNSVFRDNYASNYYADLYVSQNPPMTVKLINNTFANSRAASAWSDSPSVAVQNSNAEIIGNKFYNMTGSRNSAALLANYGSGTRKIINNTFTNCTYTGTSGGIIYIQNAYLENNIFVDSATSTVPIFSVTDFNAILNFNDNDIDGTRFVLTCNVTDDVGNKVSTSANVQFYIDGVKVGQAVATKGVASLTVNKLLENGVYNISGDYYYSNGPNPFDVKVTNGTATVNFDHSPIELWVATDGNDTYDGSENNPFLTLKHALDYGTSNSVDVTIHVKNGLYNGSGNIALSYSNVGKVTIIGESYGNAVIDAEFARAGWSGANVFTFGQNLEVTLINLTFVNVSGNPVNAYTLTMRDNIIKNSNGIRAQTGNDKVIIDNLTFINGSGQINLYNAEIYNSVFKDCNGGTSTGLLWLATNDGKTIRLENNKFINNTIAGSSGGAAYYVQGNIISINNTFDSNTLTGTGTSVAYASANKITSINDTFINNDVTSYSAQYRSTGSSPEMIIDNIKFINNTASANGAGLATTGAKINGATFINNTANGNGGAIYLLNHGSTAEVVPMSLENVVFENNKAAYGNDIFIVQGAGSNVKADLTNLTIISNDKNVTELSDTLVVSVVHPSGAIIGGGTITFYIDGKYVGVSDLINGNATYDYVGFKDGSYTLSSKYSLDNENDTYVNGTISVKISGVLDSVDLFVSDNYGDDENGTGSLTNPFKTIQKALTSGFKQSRKITVHILEGNYSGDSNVNLIIPVNVDLTIVGNGSDKTIITSSSAKYFILALAGNGVLKLSDMTIKDVTAVINSEIYIEKGATVEIDNVTFIGGQGNYGGAINTNGTLLINNSYFYDNGYANPTARQNSFAGGAIYNNGDLTIDNSIFEANHAARASVISNQGNLYVYNSEFIDSINAYALNWDGAVIANVGAGLPISNITLVNTTIKTTGRTISQLIDTSTRIYNAASSFTCIGIGTAKNIYVYNSTFDAHNATNLGANVFGAFNSWSATGGASIFPGDIYVYNTVFSNLRIVNIFYGTRNSSRIFDYCLFDNVEYLSAAFTNNPYNSLVINNSVILSKVGSKIGSVNGVNLNKTIDNNWWGNNSGKYYEAVIRYINGMNPSFSLVSQTNATPDSWLILTLNITNNTGLLQEVSLAFNVFDGENITDYNGTIPMRNFEMSVLNGTLEKSNGVIDNNIVNLFVGEENTGYYIEASVDSQILNITGDALSIGDAVILARDVEIISGYTTFNVTVLDNGNPATVGSIKVKINGKEYIASINNGTAAFEIDVLDVGIYKMEFSINDTRVFRQISNSSNLTVTNIITNNTFEFFFDENGVLRDLINATELIFDGVISDKNITAITVNRPAELLGENATLINIGINVESSNVSVIGFTINVEDLPFAINVGDASEVVIYNNIIDVNSSLDADTYGIFAANASNLNISSNIISYTANSNGTGINNVIYVFESNQTTIEYNQIDADIPSIPVTWKEVPAGSGNWVGSLISEGIVVDSSDDLLFKNNSVILSYNSAIGSYDTIYAVDIKNSNNALLENNYILANGHTYIYALVINGEDFIVTDNEISSISDSYYANAIDIEGTASGVVSKNNISAISPVLAYGVYSAMSNGDVNVNYTENNISGFADVVYGMEVGGKVENITNNTIKGIGNYTMGIGSRANNLIANGNIIVLNASNIGSPSVWDSIPYETVGVKSIAGNADIQNNNITSSGKYTVKLTGGTANVTNNYLVANEYTGDASVGYLPNKATVKDNIPAMEKLNLEAENIQSKYNDASKVNVSIKNNDENPVANMPVNLTVNGKTYNSTTDKNGIATFNIDKLPVGNYTLSYSVNKDGFSKENVQANLSVVPSDENISVELNKPVKGEDLIVSVGVPDDATGNVIVTVDGKNYTASIKDNKASVTVPNITAGTHSVNVKYHGDKNHNPSDYSTTINVENNIKINAPDVTKYYHGSERFEVTVVDNNDKIIANKSVSITINGVTYNRTTDNSGKTSIPLGLNSGKYNVTVKVEDVEAMATVTIKNTIISNDIVKIYKNGTQYYATFLDSTGKALPEGREVEFNINGVFYKRTTDVNGQAKLNINLNAGEYILTAINPVNGEQYTNIVTVLPNIVDNKDLVKYYRNGSQYVVKILGDDGKPVEGKEVSFNINGMIYTRTTNATGHAQLNINLQPGDYIITAEYNGLRASNNIKVLPVLSAKDLTMKYRDGSKFVAKLVDGQGKPYANKDVTFNINGVFYTRTTDATGQAELNINLMNGEYIITSSYEGANIANKITIS